MNKTNKRTPEFRRTLQTYSQLKESGVQWLGQVPEHWEVKRLKYLVSAPLQYGASEESGQNEEGDPRFIRITDIREDGTLRDESFCSLPVEVAKPFMLEDGDLLFARSGATVGKSFMYRSAFGKACFAGYLIRARIDKAKAEQKFINYFTSSPSYWQWLASSSIQSTIQNVNAEKYNSLALPLPPLAEQRAIAAYLDRETARLDTLISRQQRMIELSLEKRRALIGHAVTRGLDKSAPLRDSGVEWLGLVPAHWNDARKMKEVSSLKGRLGWQGLKADEYREQGPYVVSSAHFKELHIKWELCPHISSERYELDSNIQLREGDVLLMKDGAALGKLAWVDKLPDRACLNSHLLLFRSRQHSGEDLYIPQFIFFLLQSEHFQEFIKVNATGTTFLGISQETIGNYRVTLPPISEQRAIVSYLDSETAKIDTLIEKARRAIELMREHRSALIAAAVTGQIDVRAA